MKREIKFRAWDTDKKEMLTPQDISQSRAYWTWLGEFDFPIMQYTGLKDKNGKEIYEGDIVKEDIGQKYQVIYEAPRFLNKCGSGVYNLQATQYLEIIGNIYENPDMLI